MGSPDVESNELSLKKEVGFISGIGLIVGTIIGSGIFVSPGGVLAQSGSVFGSLLVWNGCGLIAVFGGLTYVELGTMIPESGAEYTYIYRGLGSLCAFINAWMAVLIMDPSSISIVCQTFAFYTVRLFTEEGTRGEDIKFYQTTVTVSALVLICTINCVSVRLTTFLQNSLAFAKLIPVAIIILGGLYCLTTGQTGELGKKFEPLPGTEPSLGSIAMAFYSGLWSYEGWNQLNFITEEIDNPNKNLPRAIVIGVSMVTVLYLLINVAYLVVIPVEVITNGDTVVAVAFVKYLLSDYADSWAYLAAPYVMTAFVALSTFGSANGILFSSSRLSFVASRNGHLPEILSYVHNTALTPVPSLVFSSFIAIAMAFLGDIESLIDFFSISAWLFYGGAFLSLIVMRFTAPQLERPFTIWIIVPILATLMSVYLVFAPIINNVAQGQATFMYLIVLGYLLAGILFYAIFVHFGLRLRGINKVYAYIRHAGNMSHGHKDKELDLNYNLL